MLTTAGLSAALQASFIAVKGTPADSALLQQFCDALAQGLVPYLVANTVVNAGIAVQVTPVTGTGATVGTGTIS